MQTKKKDAKARNPFIEYDVREKRLMRERKWLQEDSAYLMSRREELRCNKLLLSLNMGSQEELYVNRTFYGPFSIAMKAQKQRAASAGRRPQSAPSAGAEAGQRNFKEDRAALATTVKKLSQELRSSCSEQTQRGFRHHQARLQGLPVEESPRERDQLQAGMLMAFKL